MIASVTVDFDSGACLATLASDSCVIRYSASPTAADTRSVDPSVRSVTSRPARREIVDQPGDVVDAGLGCDFHRRVVEQPDGAADIGHCLPAELLGVFERVDGIVDVAVLLQAAARRGQCAAA